MSCLRKYRSPHTNGGDGKSAKDKTGEKDWRHKPPNSGKGEKKEKMVDGKLYKWCGKCRQNKGSWTTGKYLHSTEEHRPKKKDDSEDAGKANAGNLAHIDEPLDFGLLAAYEEPEKSKECSGGH